MPYPVICLNDKQHRPGEWPTLLFNQNMCGCQEVTLHEGCKALKLDKDIHRVCVTATFARSIPHAYFSVEAKIVNGEEGIIEVCVEDTDIPCRGLYLTQIDVFDITDEDLICVPNVPAKRIRSYQAYTEVAADFTDLLNNDIGVTIAEVRLSMRDICPQDNFLLDDVEFTNTEVAWAIRRPVDLWNETPPKLNKHIYEPRHFPFRYVWVNAVQGELLVMAAQNYMRNHQAYQAGGITINDKDKYQQYRQVGEKLQDEYKGWILRTKKAINWEACFNRIDLRSYDNYPSGQYGTIR